LLADAGYADGLDAELTVPQNDQTCGRCDLDSGRPMEIGINVTINAGVAADFATLTASLSYHCSSRSGIPGAAIPSTS
jgi:hypothetical protein